MRSNDVKLSLPMSAQSLLTMQWPIQLTSLAPLVACTSAQVWSTHIRRFQDEALAIIDQGDPTPALSHPYRTPVSNGFCIYMIQSERPCKLIIPTMHDHREY